MKKFLSLVLALVMTMSLVTVAGAKDFTDASDIDYAEAVEVLTAVKVIDGYTDGSFKPDAQLNRGQAAKIICNLILGPTTAGALPTSVAPFKDVPAGSTFAGYIAYCAQEGIVSGYTDGSFQPTAPLTGYAFMKMLLGALGYDKTIEGYDGNNWAVNVAKQALACGLDDGNDAFVGNAVVTRQEAMLYAFNALNTKVAYYQDKGSNITIGDVVFNTGASEVATRNYDLAYKLFGTDLVLTHPDDDFERPTNKWTYKNKTVGTYVQDADATYTAKVKGETIYADLGLEDAKSFDYYLDGASVGSFLVDDDENEFYYGNGIIVEVFEDEGKIIVTEPEVGEIDDVDEDDDGRYVTVDDYANEKFYTEDFDVEDLVVYTYADSDIQSMYAVEKEQGKLTKTVGSTLVIDGAEYKLAAYAENGSYDVGDNVDFYLDENGYIVKIVETDETADVSTFAVVEASGNQRGDWATLRYADGTKATVDTYKDYTGLDNYVVSWKASDSGVKLTAESAADHQYYNFAVTAGVPNVGNIKTDSKTTYLYKIVDGDDVSYKTVVGYKNALSVDSGYHYVNWVAEAGKAASFVYIEIADTDLSATNSTLLTFVAADDDCAKVNEGDGVVYYNVEAVVEGEIKTLKWDASDFDNINAYGMFKSLSVDADGLYTGSAADADDYYAIAEIDAVSNETIYVNFEGYTATEFAYADDILVFVADDEGKITESKLSAIKNNTVPGAKYSKMVGTLNDDLEITMLIFVEA